MTEERSITLDQFLKLWGVVGSGGQAKIMIQSGEVLVNQEIETRRRLRLSADDIVEFAGERVRVGDVL